MNYCDIHNHGSIAPDQLTSITPEEFTALFAIRYAELKDFMKSPYTNHALIKAVQHLRSLRKNSPVSMGIHPWHINTGLDMEDRFRLIGFLAEEGAIAAVGECGLDRRKPASSTADQIMVFEKQIHIAENYKIPLIIHNVRCLPDILSLRRKYKKVPWIIHGFIGNENEIKQCLRHDIMLSPGIALLRMNGITSHKMFDYLDQIPPEKMFLETDGVSMTIEEVYSIAAHYSGRKKEDLAEIMQRRFREMFLIS